MYRLFFEKEVWIWKPLRVGFHCSCNVLVESIKEDSNALCFQVASSSRLEVFLRKGVLKICSKCTGELPCRSTISIKPLFNFIDITLLQGCSPVNLSHIFRTPFLKNTSGLWMQSVWSGASILSSELKTHQESSIELNFKFQVTKKSDIKLFKRSI